MTSPIDKLIARQKFNVINSLTQEEIEEMVNTCEYDQLLKIYIALIARFDG